MNDPHAPQHQDTTEHASLPEAPNGQKEPYETVTQAHADARTLSSLAAKVLETFERTHDESIPGRVTVNPLISTVATWYEKLRNAMEFRQEEVVLRSSIERILKRRLLLGGNGKLVARPLIRELVWARYFDEETIPEDSGQQVEEIIDLFIELRNKQLTAKKLKEGTITEWMYHLMSSTIEQLLNKNKEKEMMSNLFFRIVRENIRILDDSEQVRDIQTFIAVRKSFAKDDIAFLRYHLFTQIFGRLTRENLDEVVSRFPGAYQEIQKELSYPKKDAIFNYVKRKTGIFFILEDVLHVERSRIRDLVKNEEEMKNSVYGACAARYRGISSKVRRALVRSFIFILATKALFAVAVEGTYESILYGKILWNSIILNTTIPPLMLIIIGLFISTPKRDNSQRILTYIKTILFDENPRLGSPLEIRRVGRRTGPVLTTVFSLLWFLAFVVSFGILVYILTKLHFNAISQGVFLFFLAIVSFLCYRISLMANVYTVDSKPSIFAPIVDFFFMPIVRVGRHLTEGISQINIILFLFDFIIETPFKGLFSFFEQWFIYLQSKREGLE